MTFMLILGAAAGLYLIWLLLRLAALALPLGAGIFLAFELLDRGYGAGGAIALAFLAGVLLHLTARHLYAHGGSVLLRALAALLFVVPAGAAGYHAMAGIVTLFTIEGPMAAILPAFGAAVAAMAALKGLGGASIDSGRKDGGYDHRDHAPALPAPVPADSDPI